MFKFPRFLLWLLNAYGWLKYKFNYVVKILHIKKFFDWIKKHQRLTAWMSSVIMGFSLYLVREENKALVMDNHQVQVLQERLSGKNATMNDFDWPWYKKVKRGFNYRVTGMNDAYPIYYPMVDKIKVLGLTNYDIAPKKIADGWQYTDSLVVSNWASYDNIEEAQINDSTIIPVLSHKWPGKDGRDTLVYGVSVPISKLIAVIDKDGKMELIEIVPDSVANALQDEVINEYTNDRN